MEPTYYCPMCGAWFEVGAERCESCGAPLPATAPDVGRMQRATERRSQGAALARSAVARGAQLQFTRPVLLVVPILAALLVSSLVSIAVALESSAQGGPGGFAQGVAGNARGGPSGQGLIGTLLWHVVSLFFPMSLAEQAAGTGRLFGVAIPPAGIDHCGSMLAAALGVPALPAQLGAHYSLIRSVYAALVLSVNVVQWKLIVRMLTSARPVRSRRRPSGLNTLVPVILLAMLPAADPWLRRLIAAQIPLGVEIVEGITSILLAVWATAVLVRPVGCVTTAYLVQRALCSVEGVCFLLSAMPLLWIAQETIRLLESFGFPFLEGYPVWTGVLGGAAGYTIAFCLTGTVTCGWFCLLDTLSQRPDISAILAAAEQTIPAQEAPA